MFGTSGPSQSIDVNRQSIDVNRQSASQSVSQSVSQSPHQAKETPRLVLNAKGAALPRITREYLPFYLYSYLLPPTSPSSQEHQACCRLACQPRCNCAHLQVGPLDARCHAALAFPDEVCHIPSLPARHNQAFRESCAPQYPKSALSHHKAPHPH